MVIINSMIKSIVLQIIKKRVDTIKYDPYCLNGIVIRFDLII